MIKGLIKLRTATRLFSTKPALHYKEVEVDQRLSFVQKSTHLLQITRREPNDGLFPPMKAVEDLCADDVANLIKNKQFETIKQLIDLRVEDEQTPLVNTLI